MSLLRGPQRMEVEYDIRDHLWREFQPPKERGTGPLPRGASLGSSDDGYPVLMH